MDLDSALAKVGGYKRWNAVMCLFLCLAFNIPLAFHALSIVFVGWEPPHVCIGSKSWNETSNETQLDNFNATNPWGNSISENNDTQTKLDHKCFMYGNSSTGSQAKEACEKWSYKNDGYYTIVEQYNLVCDKNFLSELSQTLFQVGSLVGEFLLFLADIYGRKTVHIFSHFFIAFFGIINAFSVSYPMFVVTKALVGTFVALGLTTGAMLILELFDSKHRFIPGMLLQIFWTVFYITLPGLAYALKSWNHLQLLISLLSIVLALLTFLMPESPAWLISRNEYDKAEKVLRNIARWNNVKLDSDAILTQVAPKTLEKINTGESNIAFTKSTTDIPSNAEEGNDSVAEEVTITNVAPSTEKTVERSKYRLLLDPVILKYNAISSLLWFACCLVFYGLILSTPGLEGSRFVNFVLMGLVEFPATFLATFFSKTIGRRLTTSLSLFTAAILVAVIIFIPTDSDSGSWAKLAVVIIAKGCITVTFATMIVYTKEFFPTNIRATCCGICQVIGRLGSLLAPMAVYMIKTKFYYIPNIIFGIISIIVSVLVLLLPDPRVRAFPDTIEECHQLNEETKFFKCLKKAK